MIKSKEDIKIADIVRMIGMYCEDYTLGEVRDLLIAERPHVCPKCAGVGYVTETYNAYPKGLPDSGWVDDYRQRDVECDVCGGHGWTVKKLVAKPVVIKYVEEDE